MPTYITAADTRVRSGAPTSLISDTDIETLIDEVEPLVARWLNTKFTPTQRIDIIDGSGNDRIFTKKKPVLAVRALNTNDTDITAGSLLVYKESGKIQLGEDSEAGMFLVKARDTKIKYLYGMLVESSTSSTTSAAEVAGTSVSIALVSITGFADEDWCEIYGMDGYKEVFQISGTPGAGAIVADKLMFSHESESIVVKLEIPEHIKIYMEIEAAIAVAINAIGATYKFNASYNLAELGVVKGVPYTHWRESCERLFKERKIMEGKIKPKFHMGM